MRTAGGARRAVATLLAAALLLSLSSRRHLSSALDVRASAQTTSAQAPIATDTDVRTACGTCHAVPPPDVLPRNAWRDEVARMMLIRDGKPEPMGPVGTAGRMIALPPDMLKVLRYYQQNAPERLRSPTTWPEPDASGFVVHPFSPTNAPPLPAISHVRLVDLDNDGTLDVVASDMRQGLLLAAVATKESGTLQILGDVPNPSHFQLFDLDGDGGRDLLVADLGSFQPADHTLGAVVWLRRLGDRRYAQKRLGGWPRVSDVEPGDFNGDGKTDLAVASFGWRKVGQLAVLENTTTDYANPAFTAHVIDPRSGSIHAVPVDMNGDGRLDIVALFAQQYQSVVLYVNNGSGFAFTPQTLYTAPHPNWGSSGIQVIDVDGDKDLDVLLTHGDTFDDQVVKPYHGVQWLENTGGNQFVEHSIADLPGVLRAQAGDLDGDGDLDIVACAFSSGQTRAEDAAGLPSLVWLEQVSPGEFRKHTLERKPPRHATLDLADIDKDGDLDIAVGNFLIGNEKVPWVEIWENRHVARTAATQYSSDR